MLCYAICCIAIFVLSLNALSGLSWVPYKHTLVVICTQYMATARQKPTAIYTVWSLQASKFERFEQLKSHLMAWSIHGYISFWCLNPKYDRFHTLNVIARLFHFRTENTFGHFYSDPFASDWNARANSDTLFECWCWCCCLCRVHHSPRNNKFRKTR